jgi:hypothetical protein
MKNLHSKNLENLVNRRKVFYDNWQASYNEETNTFGYDEPKEIDEIANEIMQYIAKHKDEIDIEVILETITYLGGSPNLLYDDNGHFAITDEGYQSVAFGDEPVDVETSFNVPKECWKKTIREALNHYLN